MIWHFDISLPFVSYIQTHMSVGSTLATLVCYFCFLVGTYIFKIKKIYTKTLSTICQNAFFTKNFSLFPFENALNQVENKFEDLIQLECTHLK